MLTFRQTLLSKPSRNSKRNQNIFIQRLNSNIAFANDYHYISWRGMSYSPLHHFEISCPFTHMIFNLQSLNENILPYSYQFKLEFNESCSISSSYLVLIGLINGMALIKWHAFFWTNDDQYQQHLQVPSEVNELNFEASANMGTKDTFSKTDPWDWQCTNSYLCVTIFVIIIIIFYLNYLLWISVAIT